MASENPKFSKESLRATVAGAAMGLAAFSADLSPAAAQTETTGAQESVESAVSTERLELYRMLQRLKAVAALLVGDATEADVARTEHVNDETLTRELENVTTESLRMQIDQYTKTIDEALRQLRSTRLG